VGKAVGDSEVERHPSHFSAAVHIFHIFTALAQFEHRLIQERTRAGLEACDRFR
jgi:DNA invertase Pin-like site-specific DNA recombinase